MAQERLSTSQAEHNFDFAQAIEAGWSRQYGSVRSTKARS
jgi:hypothetical protein